MQAIKEGSTLRVSAKKDKPEPRIVYRFGSQDGQIAEFLAYRSLIKGIIRKLQKEYAKPQMGVVQLAEA